MAATLSCLAAGADAGAASFFGCSAAFLAAGFVSDTMNLELVLVLVLVGDALYPKACER